MAVVPLTVTTPTLDSVGLSAGVTGVGGASAGMTAGVSGSGNGFNFANNGGRTILAVLNTGAGARTVTPLITPRPAGVTPTSPTRSIPAGAMHFFIFDADYENSDGTVTVEVEHAEIKALAMKAT